MKLQVVIHEAEEGADTGRKFQRFPDARRRETHSKSFRRICTKRLKGAYPWPQGKL